MLRANFTEKKNNILRQQTSFNIFHYRSFYMANITFLKANKVGNNITITFTFPQLNMAHVHCKMYVQVLVVKRPIKFYL